MVCAEHAPDPSEMVCCMKNNCVAHKVTCSIVKTPWVVDSYPFTYKSGVLTMHGTICQFALSNVCLCKLMPGLLYCKSLVLLLHQNSMIDSNLIENIVMSCMQFQDMDSINVSGT